SRSTAPAAGWPWTVEPRNRYADEDATAPAATTPLMKLRREADCGTSSDIILSSIAGSPRRAGGPTGRRGILSAHDIPYRLQVQPIFGDGHEVGYGIRSGVPFADSGTENVCKCHRRTGSG